MKMRWDIHHFPSAKATGGMNVTHKRATLIHGNLESVDAGCRDVHETKVSDPSHRPYSNRNKHTLDGWMEVLDCKFPK